MPRFSRAARRRVIDRRGDVGVDALGGRLVVDGADRRFGFLVQRLEAGDHRFQRALGGDVQAPGRIPGSRARGPLRFAFSLLRYNGGGAGCKGAGCDTIPGILTVSPQQTIGHYRIIGKLGEGGMGAVYRATDTRLNREVAVKVIPDSFANDPDRLARFQREAQVLASLNHPNIAAIYGVEDRALVMELVEGAAPAGPLTEEQALPIVQQLIDALEYAHEKGVIHRDLKPANLKVTPDGRPQSPGFRTGEGADR